MMRRVRKEYYARWQEYMWTLLEYVQVADRVVVEAKRKGAKGDDILNTRTGRTV
jgi:hypothetical protein